jgi:phosphatidate cytidylyltransferase
MVRRTVTALLLLALILPAIYLGGVLYFLYVGAFVLVAAWEYVQLFRRMDLEPSLPATIFGVLIVLLARGFWTSHAPAALTVAILAATTLHLIAFERGRDKAALDLAVTLGGIAYLGWIAAYILDLRNLSDGAWWVLLVFATVWIADSAAYFVGVRFGNHKMAPRLSPKKSWEGYFAGVIAGVLFSVLLASALSALKLLEVPRWQAAGLGLALSVLTTLGDLAESLFKRYAGAKDSGTFLPGHGGAFDRIDSLIWAAVIGYYWIVLFHL